MEQHREELPYHRIRKYFLSELTKIYGADGVQKIYAILSQYTNGTCGCETLHSTFPALLRAKGIEPTETYWKVFGYPQDDGNHAATPEQRRAILDALDNAGFPTKTL